MSRGNTPRPRPSTARCWPSGSRLLGEAPPIRTAHQLRQPRANLDYQGKHAEAEPLHRKAAGHPARRCSARVHPRHRHDLPPTRAEPGSARGSSTRPWRTGRPPPRPSTIEPAARGRLRTGAFCGLRSFAPARTGHRPGPSGPGARGVEPAGRPTSPAVCSTTSPPARSAPHPGERRREAELAGQIQGLDEQISRLAGRPGRTRDEDTQLDRLTRPAERPPGPLGRIPGSTGPAVPGVRGQALPAGGRPEGHPGGRGPGRLARVEGSTLGVRDPPRGRPRLDPDPRHGPEWGLDHRGRPSSRAAAPLPRGRSTRRGPDGGGSWPAIGSRRCGPTSRT